jgi:Cft2 family RNA processing exonuclease
VLHQDARRIMQSRLEEEGELPLFDDVAVSRLMDAFEPVPFQTRLPLSNGLVVTFYPAGHIAGAAMIGLESDDGRLLISGDVSFSSQRTVGAAKLPPFEPDVLVLESTYGGRLHANRAVQERRMVDVVREVTTGGRKVLIPAFALGRAQEILLILSEFQRRGELSSIPIWADGMVRAVCQIYSSFQESLPLPLQERGANFFGGSIQAVQTRDQRNALIWQPGPAVIVSSSGMLAGGPSMAYARALAGQPEHAILLTGYQDEESPGRRLQEMAERGRGSLWLGKDKVDVQCRLGTYSLSAHADESQLINMVETLNPAHVMLVHGDEAARASLEQACQARKRITHLPRAGQTIELRFALARPQAVKSVGAGRPLDVAQLWQAVTGANTPSGAGAIASAGDYFSLDQLALAWWGSAAGPAQQAALVQALQADDLYFGQDTRRPELFRARPPQQVDVLQARRARMAELSNLPGQWIALRGPGGAARLARCTSTARDFFWVESEDGETERAWPEDLLAQYGQQPPAEGLPKAGLALAGSLMEPNQALAEAGQSFPREARLRKTGYRLDQHILVLTFDFPDSARQRYRAQIDDLQARTGWTVEVAPEANQAALFALVQELLPPDWQVLKGPALHRQNRQVAATLAGVQLAKGDMERMRQFYQAESGFELVLTLTAAPKLSVGTQPVSGARAASGKRLEINAAYAEIRAALEGSSLYRTSLKGDQVMLSFISPQVGERYREQMEDLSARIGWPLSINPQPNQGAIQEALRVLLAHAGIEILKGPGIYPERAQVVVTAANLPEEDGQADLLIDFEERTGFQLVLQAGASSQKPAQPPASPADVTLVALTRVRLRRFHRELALDPLKIDKAVERARRLGQITPPILVRRLEDGYLLLDGLYRLRAAEKLHLEQIPAIIE